MPDSVISVSVIQDSRLATWALCPIPISCYTRFRYTHFRYTQFLLCYTWFRYTRFCYTWFQFCPLYQSPLWQVPRSLLITVLCVSKAPRSQFLEKNHTLHWNSAWVWKVQGGTKVEQKLKFPGDLKPDESFLHHFLWRFLAFLHPYQYLLAANDVMIARLLVLSPEIWIFVPRTYHTQVEFCDYKQ